MAVRDAMWAIPKHFGPLGSDSAPWALSKELRSEGVARTPTEVSQTVTQRYSLHRTLAPVLITAQTLAGLPVQGVGVASTRALRFRWMSARTAYCAIATVASAMLTVCNAMRLVRVGVSFPRSGGTVFCATHVVAGVLQLRLARMWPSLLRRWETTEAALDRRYGALASLPRTPRIIAAAVIVAGAVEHVLSYSHDVAQLLMCDGWWRALVLRRFAPLALLNEVPPDAILALSATGLALLVLIEAFSWAFVDVLIIVLSIALSERFRQINSRLRTLRARHVPQEEWRALREDYNSLSFLTRTLDAALSQLVLLSFGNNLYFICLQLLQSMKPAEGPEGTLAATYFYWSFGYLLLKTSGVALCAADVHEQARGPRHLLYDVPADNYCSEVQRFLTQVATDDVALTGLNFFAVTRTLLLTIAGTIVTYEIVLVQFSSLGDADGGGDGAQRNTTHTPTGLCDGYLAD